MQRNMVSSEERSLLQHIPVFLEYHYSYQKLYSVRRLVLLATVEKNNYVNYLSIIQ